MQTSSQIVSSNYNNVDPKPEDIDILKVMFEL